MTVDENAACATIGCVQLGEIGWSGVGGPRRSEGRPSAFAGIEVLDGDRVRVGAGAWMARNHGLTIDSLVAADIVAPDDVPGLLDGWMDAHRNGPEELNSTLVFFPELGDPMPPAGLMGLVCYAGPDTAAAAAAFAPLLSLGTVRMSQIDEKPYADVLEEPHPPAGVRSLASNTLVERVDDRVVDAVDRYYAGGSTERMMFIRQLGGAVNRVAPDATAFAHRNVEALVLGGLFAPEDTSDDDLLARLQPFEEFHDLGVGSYPGFVATNLPEDVERIYPPATLARLREVKRANDPGNVFRNNFNIAP